MAENPGHRRSSDRIRLLTSFSKFTNDPDTPLDEDRYMITIQPKGIDTMAAEEGVQRVKHTKSSIRKRAMSLNEIMLANISKCVSKGIKSQSQGDQDVMGTNNKDETAIQSASIGLTTGRTPREFNKVDVVTINIPSSSEPIGKRQRTSFNEDDITTTVNKDHKTSVVVRMAHQSKHVANIQPRNSGGSSGIKGILKKPTKPSERLKRPTMGYVDPLYTPEQHENSPSNHSDGNKRRTRSDVKKVSFSSIKNTDEEDVIRITASDDDFQVEQPFMQEGKTRSKSGKKQRTTEKTQKRGNVKKKGCNIKKGRTVDGIRTRTSPITLFNTIKNLNPEQKEAVKQIGFGSLLGMTVDGIPTKLGFFVVDNLNTTNMFLRVGDRNIVLNESMVHDILGVPKIGLDLDKLDVDNRSMKLISEWNNYVKKDRPRPTDVMNSILSCTNASHLFKISFLSLVVNLLGECCSTGSCNINFLYKISSVDMIRRINWSRYIYECVRRSKSKWRRDTYKSFYNGPLTFLTLLYVQKTVCEEVQVPRMLKPINEWTMELLRQRQRCGLKKGGLEMAELRVAEDPQTTETDPDNDAEFRQCEEDQEALLKREYTEKINTKITLMVTTKWEAEVAIDEAIQRFPNDDLFRDFKENLRTLLKSEFDNKSRHSNEFEVGTSGVNDDNNSSDDIGISDADEENMMDTITPTRLNFDERSPLEEIQCLSPVLVRQNPGVIIDDSVHKKTQTCDNETDANNNSNLVNDDYTTPPSYAQHSFDLPSFSLGFSQDSQCDSKMEKEKGKKIRGM